MPRCSLKASFAGFNVKAAIGSGFLWAWFDAFFMSVFFMPSGQQGLTSEVATIGTFALGIPVYVLTMRHSDAMRRMVAKRRNAVVVGCAGTAGSLILVCSGFAGGWALVVAGAVLCAIFMSFAGLAWGAVYSSDGARSAMLYVAGGFAFAFVIDIPLLLMIPIASACFFALLPLASSLLWLTLDRGQRSYESQLEPLEESRRASQKRPRCYLGVSLSVLCAVMLIMTGFGYIQHLVSFAPLMDESAVPSGVFVQSARGMVAVLAFLFAAVMPKHVSGMYRVGLLAMVAGFSLMPFLYDGRSFGVPGAIIIGGYTVFDVLSWVIFSQVAYARSHEPVKVIAVMRLIVSACYMVGAVAGLALSAALPTSAHMFEEAIFVGYLMTVAIVLLLGSKEVWELFGVEVEAGVGAVGGAEAAMRLLAVSGGGVRRA